MEEDLKEGIYMYCIIDSNQFKSIGSMGIGGRGDEIYTLCFNDIAAVVSHSPIKKYRISRENTINHEKIIEEVMKKHTLLPVRFNTIAEDEKKVKKILERENKRFVDLLKYFKEKKELGIKAIFNEDLIYKDILNKNRDIRVFKKNIAALPPEKTYSQCRKIGKMVESALQKEKEIHKKDIINTLSPLAVDVKINITYYELMIIAAAFLVEKHQEAEFDQKVEELDTKYGDKIKIKYVGTVPPFDFVNLTIKTEEY